MTEIDNNDDKEDNELKEYFTYSHIKGREFIDNDGQHYKSKNLDFTNKDFVGIVGTYVMAEDGIYRSYGTLDETEDCMKKDNMIFIDYRKHEKHIIYDVLDRLYILTEDKLPNIKYDVLLGSDMAINANIKNNQIVISEELKTFEAFKERSLYNIDIMNNYINYDENNKEYYTLEFLEVTKHVGWRTNKTNYFDKDPIFLYYIFYDKKNYTEAFLSCKNQLFCEVIKNITPEQDTDET